MIVATHRIADIIFRTESDVPIPHLQRPTFDQFRIGDVEPDVLHRIHYFELDSLTLPVLDREERERISRSVGLQRLLSQNPIFRSPVVRERVRVCLDHADQVYMRITGMGLVIYDFARNEFHYFFPSGVKEYFAGPLMVGAFQNLLSTFLSNFSAIMIHSAGVVRNGSAALFIASDEGGKTSLVRPLTGEPVLSDDNVVLRKEDGVFNVHGTPLGVITSGPLTARLGGFFLLEKASSFGLSPLKPRDAIQFLWNEHAHLWHILPKNLRLQAFEILYDACRQAPTYRLRLPKDHVDWDAIDATMTG